MRRYGSLIKLRPEKLDEYKELHANAWPDVLAMIWKCNIRNYSIYFKDGFLFSYFEYIGEDYDADMALMAADPTTQKWWKLTDPCQEPIETRKEGSGGPAWKSSFMLIEKVTAVNARQRFLAAINHTEPDGVPVDLGGYTQFGYFCNGLWQTGRAPGAEGQAKLGV